MNDHTLTLPRKGNYGRALEEAILGQRSQWPRAWEKTNPLNGGRSFNTMSATERVSGPAPYLLHSTADENSSCYSKPSYYGV